MADKPDPMTPDGEVTPISTDYKVGQDNICLLYTSPSPRD